MSYLRGTCNKVRSYVTTGYHAQAFYLIAVACFMFSRVTNVSNIDGTLWGDWFGKLLLIVFFLLVGVKGLCTLGLYRPWEIGISCAILAFIVLNWLVTGEFLRTYVMMIPLALGAKDVSFKDICKVSFISVVLGILAVMCASSLGLIWAWTTSEFSNLFGIEVVRNSFGFSHFNNFGMAFFMAFLSYLYVRWERFCIGEYVAWFMASAFLFLVVTSKMASFLVVGLLVFRGVVGCVGHMLSDKILLRIIGCGAVLAVLAGIVLPYMINPNSTVLSDLDYFLSYRLSSANYFLLEYVPGVFSQHLDVLDTLTALAIGETPRLLDNGFIALLLSNGVVFFGIFAVVYVLLVRRALRTGDVVLLLMITAILITGNMEIWLFFWPACVLLPALSARIQGERGSEGILHVPKRRRSSDSDGS